MIRAKQLVREYGRKPAVTALDGVTLSIDAAERVAVVGKSGSGKTTLLNILAGLDRPTSGSLIVDDQEITKIGSRELARYRAKTIGVVFQSFQLIPQQTAAQNVELPLIILGINKAERSQRVREALGQVGLSDRLTHRPAELSGGEQQRVALARAIVGEPKVILADEPTGNLDSATADTVRDLIVSVCDRLDATLILITHDDELARQTAGRIVRMQDGRIVQDTPR